MAQQYKRLKRELVSKGAIIDYYHDIMEIPNGKTATWDFIDHKGAAAVVAVKPDGKLVMVRQYRNALERDTIEIPAGGLNPGESMKEAAIRELKEETGFETDEVEFLLSIRTTVAFCNERIDIFLAKNLTPGEQNPDEDEYVEIEEYTLEELVEMINRGVIQDSKTVSAILCYYAKIMK